MNMTDWISVPVGVRESVPRVHEAEQLPLYGGDGRSGLVLLAQAGKGRLERPEGYAGWPARYVGYIFTKGRRGAEDGWG